MTTSYCRYSPSLPREENVLHAFLSPRSDLEVSLVQWQGKAGWDVPALYWSYVREIPTGLDAANGLLFL